MNKMNKKGFTLIEMLVVIAIIAVLVSIIIPTVTSATDKAAAAANAANLRSIKAEFVSAYLTNDDTVYTVEKDDAGTVTVTTTRDMPDVKGMKTAVEDVELDKTSSGYAVTIDEDETITLYIVESGYYFDVASFAAAAEGEDLNGVAEDDLPDTADLYELWMPAADDEA